MIKMLTAYTTEIDEVDDALKEIFSQIDIGSLSKNNVGLITCNFDYIETGFLSEISKKLPFPIIGMTTMASANIHGHSMYSCALTVLTSDDVEFVTAITNALENDNYREEISGTYKKARAKLPGDPSLIFTFFPVHKTLSGALMIRAFDEACGGIPFWGSLSTNIEIIHEKSHVFLNGETSPDVLAILLLYGPVKADFVVVSMPEMNIMQNRGIITDSEDCVIKSINGLPAKKYFESLGVIIMPTAATNTPIMVYYEGTTEPVALAIFSINDDGSLLCGGEMPKGAAVAIGEINSSGIIASATAGLDRLLQSGLKGGAFLLPCVTRYVMLTPNQSSEINLATDKFGKKIPFMLAYSGGEICPVRDETGKLQNRFHNYTFSACIVE